MFSQEVWVFFGGGGHLFCFFVDRLSLCREIRAEDPVACLGFFLNANCGYFNHLNHHITGTSSHSSYVAFGPVSPSALTPGGESPAGMGLNVSPSLTDGAQERGVTACVSQWLNAGPISNRASHLQVLLIIQTMHSSASHTHTLGPRPRAIGSQSSSSGISSAASFMVTTVIPPMTSVSLVRIGVRARHSRAPPPPPPRSTSTC